MAKTALYVLDGRKKVPFLRGMVTHALIARGLSFKQAYTTANVVRNQLRSHGTITIEKLSGHIERVLRQRYGHEFDVAPENSSPVPTIMVRAGDSPSPFSKGVVSQSLQASGLEPMEAYNIALDLQTDLINEGVEEIDRDQLRRLIYEELTSRKGSDVSERYLLWRYLQSPDRPIIILIGGATGTGKTSLSTEVGHRLGIDKVLSSDTIRQMMRMMFSKDLLPTIHCSSYEAWKQSAPKAKPTAHRIITGFREQCERVLVGVRAMIDRAIQENSNVILDGVHLVPGMINLKEFQDQAYVIPVVVSTLNQKAYLERFPHREQREGKRKAHRYRENFDAIWEIQNYILGMAERDKIPIVENKSIDDSVTSLLTVITRSLREQIDMKESELVKRAL